MIRITRNQVTCRFGSERDPVVVVAPGAEVVFETLDAHSGTVPEGGVGEDVRFPDLTEDNANPVTGLVAVEGAEPGDTLAVTIKKIDPVGQGFIPVRPKAGILFDMTSEPLARIIYIKDRQWFLNEKWAFPLRPMVGTIGTALPGKGIPTMFPGDHGGNMDNNFVREGAVVHLPVRVQGALLGIGDVHASMGDGEATSGGIDVCADVEVQIDLIKGGGLTSVPYIIFEDRLVVCGHGPNLVSAVESVTREAVKIVSAKLEISPREAYQVISALGDINICQACNCMGVDVTTRVVIPIVWR